MSKKYFCLCMFFIVYLSMLPSYGDTNLLKNPGFEDGTSGWSHRNCSIDTVSSPVHSGSASGRAFKRTATWQGIKQSMLGKISEGTTYEISAWVRLENAPNDVVTVSFEQIDDDGTKYVNVGSNTATDSGWVELSGDFTMYANGKLKRLDIYFEGPAEGVNFFVDDANVCGPPPAPVAPVDPNKSGQGIEDFGVSCTETLVNEPQEDRLYDILFDQMSLDKYGIRNTYDIEPETVPETVAMIEQCEAVIDRD